MRSLFLSMGAAAMLTAACQSKQKPVAPPPPPASMTIHAKDYSFDAPNEVSAGVTTVHLVNDGPGLHHAIFVRLDSAKTVADLLDALKKPGALPAWALFAGGPNVPEPGTASDATLDLAPGNYAIICILNMPGGVPHFMRGMVRPLTVTAAPATAAGTPKAVLPVADNMITLIDYTFALAKPITTGTHTFQVVTALGQPHEVLVVRLNAGKTGQQYVDWIQSMRGPAPGRAMGGTAAAAAGVAQLFTITFEPGDYLLICLVPDAKNGKLHFMNGMMQVVTVK